MYSCDDEQVAQYDEVLCQLAELVEAEARAHVAKLLAPLDRAPGNVRRLEGGNLFDHYLSSFDRVWDSASPVTTTPG